MHDDDTQLVKLEEEPRLAIWVVYHRLLRQEAEKYIALTLLMLLTAATLLEIMAKAFT